MEFLTGFGFQETNLLKTRQPTTDFTFEDNRCAFAYVGDWKITVDLEGVCIVREGYLGGPIARRIEFDEILHGDDVFNPVQRSPSRASSGIDESDDSGSESDASDHIDDQRREITELKAKVKDLEESLEEMGERFEETERDLRETEKNLQEKMKHLEECLEEAGERLEESEENLEETEESLEQMVAHYLWEKQQVAFFRDEVDRVHETIAPLARRCLLDKARNMILRCYFDTKNQPSQIPTLKGRPTNKQRSSQSIHSQFVHSLSKSGSSILFQDIHDVVTRKWPGLDVEVIKMACESNEIRQAGNEAAHVFDCDSMVMSLHVNTEDMDEDDLETLKSVYRWWASVEMPGEFTGV
ncbi:hypothetical protein BDN72DRAFT_846127 [Pluteus cervinus]|uniref:Uncharacterized protein n=1 Tax=Pluteus cervinus TaxID=181527 RepID=A0ACD3AH41_9AGAR|nr:hypothetical protein BDN72DRAFT_846127 [Pluteus cervinus]